MIVSQGYDYVSRRRQERREWAASSTQPVRFDVSRFNRGQYSCFADQRYFRVIDDRIDTHGRRTTATLPRMQTMTRFASLDTSLDTSFDAASLAPRLSPMSVTALAMPSRDQNLPYPVPPAVVSVVSVVAGWEGAGRLSVSSGLSQISQASEDTFYGELDCGGLEGDDVLTSPILRPGRPLTPFEGVASSMDSIALMEEEEVFLTPAPWGNAAKADDDAGSWASLGPDIHEMNLEEEEEEAAAAPWWKIW
jgi:hypothetical protein